MLEARKLDIFVRSPNKPSFGRASGDLIEKLVQEGSEDLCVAAHRPSFDEGKQARLELATGNARS